MTPARLEEFKALRGEIVSDINLMGQIYNYSLLILVTLISGIALFLFQSLAKETSFSIILILLPLGPILLILPVGYFLLELRKSIFLCGTYIQVFLEDGIELKYETALAERRDARDANKTSKKFGNEESFDPIIKTYTALFVVCVGLFLYTIYKMIPPSTWEWRLYLIYILILIYGGYKFYLLTKQYNDVPNKMRREFHYEWLQIKKKMDKSTLILSK